MPPTPAALVTKSGMVRNKKVLFDESVSSSEDDQEDGGVALGPRTELKINQEYARRFEHNKKREELHRLEEKYKAGGGSGSGSDSSSDDETEDEDGFLITEDLDAEISATLQAIKSKDPRIYDKNAVFYKPVDPDTEISQEKKEKPVFLRDYHRERYMRGGVGADDEDDEATEQPRTYLEEQETLKKDIIKTINGITGGDDSEAWSDDDAFIKPKEKPQQPTENGMHPSRAAAMKLTEVDVANADKDPEEYLSKFMAAKAWAPEDGSRWQAFESDDGEEDDDFAEEFEHAYNMRFEDPEKSNEVLKSYSRSVVAARSVRKEELKGRKKQRMLEMEKKEAEKREREEERRRLRRLKIEEAEEKLQKIKKAAGMSGKTLQEAEWMKFLDDAWEDDKWKEEMKRRFGEDYYAEADEMVGSDEDETGDGSSGSKKQKKPKKPKWDDDINIKDIIPDFEDETKPNITLSDLDNEPEGHGEQEDEGKSESGSESEAERPVKKRKTAKNIKKDRMEAKREARRELARIEALVDSKMELDDPRILAAGPSSSSKSGSGASGFRYRQTSPNSFGMTARDILLAPSDAALNEFAGLKKLATFRDPVKKRRDKKRLGKKARLRQWRRETFGRKYEETGPTFGFATAEQPSVQDSPKRADDAVVVAEKDGERSGVNVVDGERKKKRKRSKGGKAVKA